MTRKWQYRENLVRLVKGWWSVKPPPAFFNDVMEALSEITIHRATTYGEVEVGPCTQTALSTLRMQLEHVGQSCERSTQTVEWMVSELEELWRYGIVEDVAEDTIALLDKYLAVEETDPVAATDVLNQLIGTLEGA